VKEYLFWFDMPGEHIADIVVAAGASAIRADFAAADHRRSTKQWSIDAWLREQVRAAARSARSK
jgi:hypothetical protein